MPAIESQNVTLNVEEWELLAELLRREIRNLPGEIHHTDIRSAREALQKYMLRAEALYEKLRPIVEA